MLVGGGMVLDRPECSDCAETANINDMFHPNLNRFGGVITKKYFRNPHSDLNNDLIIYYNNYYIIYINYYNI